MIPGINSSMISMLIKMKLDEVLKGEVPEGIKIIQQTPEKIVLSTDPDEFLEGIQINSLNLSITHKGTEIILQS